MYDPVIDETYVKEALYFSGSKNTNSTFSDQCIYFSLNEDFSPQWYPMAMNIKPKKKSVFLTDKVCFNEVLG